MEEFPFNISFIILLPGKDFSWKSSIWVWSSRNALKGAELGWGSSSQSLQD